MSEAKKSQIRAKRSEEEREDWVPPCGFEICEDAQRYGCAACDPEQAARAENSTPAAVLQQALEKYDETHDGPGGVHDVDLRT